MIYRGSYILQRREVTKAVKKAKNDWLQKKASEVEVAMLFGGSQRSMWKSLRELERSRVGLRPVRMRTIKKANGDPCESVGESVNRSVCDNWRSISLLDIGGKLFAKTIQSRLQDVAEVLPDSQCGFWRGRGYVDMIFCARQMIEKAVEHNTKIFMLFIDLHKAYDSVPLQTLWRALESYSVPESLIRMIRSLHDVMKAEVTVDGQVALEFEVRNRLRQGCVLAPTLFIVHFNLVIGQWRERCVELELMYCTSVVESWWERERESPS